MRALRDVFLFLALLNLLPVSSMDQPPLSSPEAMAMGEEKIRLGSTPPSCHNRCNRCSPCTAVQVPAPPVGSGGAGRQAGPETAPPTFGNQLYSDYKPLGWKCRCGSRIYDP